ncbi:MAG: hypothetical protein FWF59_07240 [Turicibacter sp.]|nr:hypothetical protein [Turicibacter sp.]
MTPPEKESFAKRVKRESTGYHLLNPKLVEEEKRTHHGYIIQVMKELGRPLSEDELRELGNIL